MHRPYDLFVLALNTRFLSFCRVPHDLRAHFCDLGLRLALLSHVHHLGAYHASASHRPSARDVAWDVVCCSSRRSRGTWRSIYDGVKALILFDGVDLRLSFPIHHPLASACYASEAFRVDCFDEDSHYPVSCLCW